MEPRRTDLRSTGKRVTTVVGHRLNLWIIFFLLSQRPLGEKSSPSEFWGILWQHRERTKSFGLLLAAWQPWL
jgi:hypothetical protein